MASRFVQPFAVFINRNGVPLPFAKAYFYAAGTTTLQNTFQNNGLTIPNSNPVVADANGYFGNIFLSGLQYGWKLTDANDVQIQQADPINNDASVLVQLASTTPGSDGASLVGFYDEINESAYTVHQILTLILGRLDVLEADVAELQMELDDAILPAGLPSLWSSLLPPAGWVIQDGGTIGNADSGASNRANADCEDLFIHLWNNYSDTAAPVLPGGRGATAVDDFDADKTIQLPYVNGKGIVINSTGLPTYTFSTANVDITNDEIDLGTFGPSVIPFGVAKVQFTGSSLPVPIIGATDYWIRQSTVTSTAVMIYENSTDAVNQENELDITISGGGNMLLQWTMYNDLGFWYGQQKHYGIEEELFGHNHDIDPSSGALGGSGGDRYATGDNEPQPNPIETLPTGGDMGAPVAPPSVIFSLIWKL